jgi:caspase 7
MFLNDEKRRRHGTEKDEEELVKSMSKIGCENRITVHRDLNKREIFNCITKFRYLVEKSLPDFTVVVILSHGNQNPKTGHDEIMDVHMNGIPIWKIKNSLIDGNKCPAMIGKPKLFFVQACRGKKEQIPSWGMFRYLCET